jgi:septum formation protein
LIILASQSPRRQQLLKEAGFDFQVVVPNVDETMNPSLPIDDQILEVAYRKAEDVKKINPNDTILAADTVVVSQGKILGKPKNAEQAKDMLQQLSNQTHEVKTAVVILNEDPLSFVETSVVTFTTLNDNDIQWYLESNEWVDKAGAYGIQGLASKFVTNLDGSFENVMGLPIEKIKGLL